MTKEVIEFGRTLAKARAELDEINRRGEGQFSPVTRKLTEAELRAVMPDEPAPAPERFPPVWIAKLYIWGMALLLALWGLDAVFTAIVEGM